MRKEINKLQNEVKRAWNNKNFAEFRELSHKLTMILCAEKRMRLAA